MSERIERVYVFVTRNEQGVEGIPYYPDQRGWPALMIATDRASVQTLKPIAAQAARAIGQTIVLVRFEARTELEELPP